MPPSPSHSHPPPQRGRERNPEDTGGVNETRGGWGTPEETLHAKEDLPSEMRMHERRKKGGARTLHEIRASKSNRPRIPKTPLTPRQRTWVERGTPKGEERERLKETHREKINQARLTKRMEQKQTIMSEHQPPPDKSCDHERSLMVAKKGIARKRPTKELKADKERKAPP